MTNRPALFTIQGAHAARRAVDGRADIEHASGSFRFVRLTGPDRASDLEAARRASPSLGIRPDGTLTA